MQLGRLFISTFIEVFFVLKSSVTACKIFGYRNSHFILKEPVKFEAVIKFAFIWNRVVYHHELKGITVVQDHTC